MVLWELRKGLGFKPQLCYVLPVGTWANHLTSLSFGRFPPPICKMRTIFPTLWGNREE